MKPTPYLAYREGLLCMEGIALPDLAETLGTPFFLISEARLRANYQALERGLSQAGSGTVLRYCAKTNHEAAVLELLARCGSHLLASHAAEVALAVRCGFSPERIAYARPVLTAEELDSVLAAGVPRIHVHRPGDLPLLEAAAKKAERRFQVSFRLRGRKEFSLSPLSRLNQRLGFDEEELLESIRQLAGSTWMEPAAINFYLGTQQSSLDGFTRAFRGLLRFIARIAVETGVKIGEVNLGGGIPSPSLQRVGPRRLFARWRDRSGPLPGTSRQEEFAARLGVRFRELVENAKLTYPVTLAAEPGRAVVGDAAVMVTRVSAVEGRWAFLDASRNFLPESPVLFARRLLPLRERIGGKSRFYDLSGSTLNTLDVLDFHRRLPMLRPGDFLAFCDAGAYSVSRASPYAGLPPAVYTLREDGTVNLARRAGGLQDLVAPMESL